MERKDRIAALVANPHSPIKDVKQLEALNDDTSLVTMSIGGNDLGFGEVLAACVLNGGSGVA